MTDVSTYIKVDDHIAENPKIIRLSDAAAWMYVAGICFCARQLTDGFIPHEVVPRLVHSRKYKQLAKELVDGGLWIRHAQTYEVHDYLKHQRSRAEVEEQREKSRVRQRKHRELSRVTNKEVRGPEVEVVTESEINTKTKKQNPPLTPPGGDDGFEDFWKNYPSRNGLKGSKKNAATAWQRLTDEKRSLAFGALGAYGRAANGFPKDAERYLRGEMWEGLEAPAERRSEYPDL